MAELSSSNFTAKAKSNSVARLSCAPTNSSKPKNLEPTPSATAPVSLILTPPIQPSTFLAPRSRLTLSAFRRPECTVRLTDADPSRVIHTEYELLDPDICRTLGHGASSTVRLAYRRCDEQPVAVKTIAKHDALGLWSKSDRWRLSVRHKISSGADGEKDTHATTPRLDEVDVLTSLRGICPNVVQLLDVYETDHEVQLVLEYCEGGDLFDCIKRRRQQFLEQGKNNNYHATSIHGNFLESEASGIAKTLLNVLKILHDRNIVHRDIKPENILLTEDDSHYGLGRNISVKLTDFGLARILRHEEDDEGSDDSLDEAFFEPSNSTPEAVRRQRSRAYSRVGSDYYSAPEVNVGLGYDTPIDIYSLGITLYVMLCGAPPSSPFIDEFFKTRADSLSDGDSSSSSDSESVPTSSPSSDLFPPELDISPQAQDFICKMINPDPSLRLTAANALNHEWITQHEVPEEEKPQASPTKERTRSLSIAETEALLRIPIQGSVHEIAPPVIPPSNSPTSRGAKCTQPIEVPTPPSASSHAQVSVSLTLADVCSKLVPLADKQKHHGRRRKHHRHTPTAMDMLKSPSNKRDNEDTGCQASQKKVRVESRASSPPAFLHVPPNPSCANNRIGRRYHSPVPSGTPFIGPMLPQNKNVAVRGAN